MAQQSPPAAPAPALDPEAIARRLDAARERLGLTFVELHQRLEAATPAGQECVTHEAVRRYCRGETWPVANGANFLRLCEVLGESPLWVLFAIRTPKTTGRVALSEDESEFVALYRALAPELRKSLLGMAQALSGKVPGGKVAKARAAPRPVTTVAKKPRGAGRWAVLGAAQLGELTLF